MTVDIQKYTNLLKDFETFLQNHIDQETLDILKIEYQEVINSKRTLENIVDIKDLLKVLEKRAVLQYDNISVLHKIAENFVRDEYLDDLILNYEQWLIEHVTEINNLFNCGKSLNLIISREHISNECKTDEIYNVTLQKNVPNLESEDQCNESLLLQVSNVTLNVQNYTDKRKVLNLTFLKKCSNEYKQKKYIFIIIIISLLVLTVSVIRVFYISTATIPEVEEHSNTSEYQFEPKITLLTPNINPELSTTSSTTSAPTTTMSIVDYEKELQTLVVNKISRKIGKYWAEVSRRLDIDEIDIEEIENKYMEEIYRYEKMFKEALKIYFSEKHLNWKKDLMRALEASKRRDLKEEVEKIVY